MSPLFGIRCADCGEYVPPDERAYDDFPDLCAYCWARANRSSLSLGVRFLFWAAKFWRDRVVRTLRRWKSP